MLKVKKLSYLGGTMTLLTSDDRLRLILTLYLDAKKYVIDAGFAEEIDWQQSLSLELVSESVFLRECAWVILCSGMSELVIRRIFPAVSMAFLDWRSAAEIIDQSEYCRAQALSIFRNKKKVSALVEVAQLTSRIGIEEVKRGIAQEGEGYLEKFPFIGPVTSRHLAKNLGFDVVKPDRHLVRIASVLGYGSADDLCQAISDLIEDPVSVVDVVLWRYATLRRNYLSGFKSAICNA